MIIQNAQNPLQLFGEEDLYFFAFGYEHRSYSLYDDLCEKYPNAKKTIFAFDDYTHYPHVNSKIQALREEGCLIHLENYSSSSDVHEKILETVKQHIVEKEEITVHIDYSSMPRSWYCKLPMLLQSVMRETDKIYFWYSEGEYPATHEEYPTSGIDSFSFFSGKPSLQIENSRVHIVALGYDAIRTQAILSITDPSYLVSCYAYNPEQEGLLGNLKQINDLIFSQSAMSIALHVDDFDFMVSKLCDAVNELLPIGDVVLIPDGPKPLIFAMSLVPNLLKKQGVMCLHIARNNDFFEAVDVTPTKKVFGFLLQVENDINTEC